MSGPGAGVSRRILVIAGGLALAAATGCLSPTPRALTVWLASGDEEIATDTPPNPENDVYSAARGRLRLRAALNETLGVQLALRTATPPAGPFDVYVSDLVGPEDTLAARTAISLYRVHYTRVERFRSWYPQYTGRTATPTLLPDILVPWEAPRGGGPLRLSESRNEIVWIDVHVPPTIAPGEYRGRLEIRGTSNRAIFGCDIHLEVLPVALPGQRSLPVICRVDPRDLLRAHLQWPTAPAEQTRLLPGVPSHLHAVRLVTETMRVLHEHRATPVLWASFPTIRPTGARTVTVEWEEYDRLVAGWLDGSAFSDRVRLEAWPIPASLEHPSAVLNGGFGSPRYARLLAAYLSECQRHFAERGWLDRAFLRVCPPEPLTQSAVARMRRLSGIVRQSETRLPIVAHLPARSLRGLGWQGAPSVDLPDVDIWAPPAAWYEPQVMERQRQLGQHTWLMPDQPPYSGSLAVEAPPTDARVLPWQAYRYGVQGIWVEHAAELDAASSPARPWAGPGLLYPAEPYGLRDRPAPSLRLKRLRRGLQDYELLRLLEVNGQRLLAEKLAAQIVRWAATDACRENLLSCRESGWPRNPAVLREARELMLIELAGQFEPDSAARQRQIESLASWGRMMSQAERVVVTVDGVRLSAQPDGLHAHVAGEVLNATNRTLQGRWVWDTRPPGWEPVGDVLTNVPSGSQRPACLELRLAGFAYNVDGVYPFEVTFDTEALGVFRVPARLAVAACPLVQSAPRIDGRLDDWPLASNNAAGDFRLCRIRATEPEPRADRPALPTQAFFSTDEERLYVGVRCALRGRAGPKWKADNNIPIDGAIPWGEDVVEILLDPRGAIDGTSSDLYCLQIKPSGLLVASKGCRMQPPMGTTQVWASGAHVAVNIGPDAWVVELALPLAALPPEARQNRAWGFNVTRLDARRGEYSSWSGARGHCYRPRSLGNLIMPWP